MKTAVYSLFFLLFQSCCIVASVSDVYEELWDKNQDIANLTLNVDFLKQMQVNRLQADRYVSFTLQDINYVVEVSKMLEKLSSNITQPDIKQFIKDRYASYNKFKDFLMKTFSFTTVPPITPTPVMEKYLSDYRALMIKEPIYFAVALLPCSRLWVWLANHLDICETNVYFTWKESNKGGHPEKFKDLINKHIQTAEQMKFASDVFRMQMMNEYRFFASS